MSEAKTANEQTITGERADLPAVLAKSRYFLCFTTRDLTDEQAGRRTTVSELCLGGLIKHVTSIERGGELPPARPVGAARLRRPDRGRLGPAYRRVPHAARLTHIVAETAQHAGHADIIRESLDGQKSMGCPSLWDRRQARS